MTEAEMSPAEARSYTIGYARASLDGIFADVGIQSALDTSWVPGATTARYRRRWVLARAAETGPSVRLGRIGFVNERELTTLFFDPEINDFRQGVAPSGVVVPFGISMVDGTIAYQLRSGLVREGTFTGALESLLNQHGAQFVWSVGSLTEIRPYEEWRPQIARVTGFDFRLERPNPHYHGDVLAEELIEKVRLEYVRLTGVERDGIGIDVESDPFTQALDHVVRDYGRASLRGLDLEGEESVWVKFRGRAASVLARRRIRSVGGEEAPIEVIRQSLLDVPKFGAEVIQGDADEPASS